MNSHTTKFTESKLPLSKLAKNRASTRLRPSSSHPNPNLEAWRLENQLVAIEGVIGVGKTSLARRLAHRWDCGSHYEHFEDNPFLTRGFYEDQKRYGFNTELFFLLTRYRQQESFKTLRGLNVVDYMFEKNKIFAQLNLSGVDQKIYELTYNNFVGQIRKPDLVVLLEADLESLLRRIYNRDREFERNLCPSYLEKLVNAYYDFFSNYSETPVLRIQTSGLDFVQDNEDFELVANRIEERLTGLVQLSFAHETNSSRVASKS